MFARFFIDRPIFAAVLSILVTLGGVVGLARLPVALYPDITPPTIEVSTNYPGAHCRTLADTVAAPIEESVNGVEGMMYMTSTSGNDGTYALTVTFKPGTDLNIAQVLVQSRVNTATPKLPAEVRRRGVTVKKKSAGVLMIVNLTSPDKSRPDLYLSNYATIQLRDELARLDGIGDIVFLGQRDYSMRVWINPYKLAARGLKPADVTRAIEQQNAQVAAGQIGQPPVPTGQAFQFTINTLGRLAEPKQFEEMILKADDEGRSVRMKDVTDKIELGATAYDQTCTLDGNPSIALSIYQLPGSNAINVAAAVKKKMAELQTRFPTGLEYQIVYDTTPFIEESVREVFLTLRDAVILVALVMLVFLQSWRSALVPLAAVPVAIVGTFGAMALLGYSLNTLTLFGLVLAVGIVVDDAIVVVEAVEYHIARGLSPKDATVLAMEQVAGPVIAVGLVLAAVFVPCVFITGIIGQFYRQFAVTIAISTLLSTFNSLTLSPALCALLLRSHGHAGGDRPRRRWTRHLLIPLSFAAAAYFLLAPHIRPLVEGALPSAMGAGVRAELAGVVAAVAGAGLGVLVSLFFNRLFELFTAGYSRVVRVLLWVAPVVLLGYAALTGMTWHLLTTTPVGFIPPQDKGYLLLTLDLPPSASLSATETTVKAVEAAVRQLPGVRHTVAVAGQAALLGGNAANAATVYVMLDPFEDRRDPDRSAEALRTKVKAVCEARAPNAAVTVNGAPPVDGLGATGGFRIMIEDREATDPSGAGLQRVGAAVTDAADAAEKKAADGTGEAPQVKEVSAGFRADAPWLELFIDRPALESSKVSLDDVRKVLQTSFGSEYVNDFNRFGRTWQVNVQADQRFRDEARDLRRLTVPNRDGQMVPLSAFFKARDVLGPVLVIRHNLHPVSPVTASPADGVSSGDALAALEKLTNDRLEQGQKTEWTELALLQLESGDTALWAFVLSVLLVFLVLAAQYESWALPLAVILVVPMCLLSAAVGVRLAGLDINIFTQIGFVVLVGLASKNAILIVEFAKQRREAGASPREATLDACRLRLRPIIMTSVAFILGVVPLVLSEGAGAEMRHTLGTAVFAGMIGVTAFGIFLTPVFFFVITWLVDAVRGVKPDEPVALVADEPRSAPAHLVVKPSANGVHDPATAARRPTPAEVR